MVWRLSGAKPLSEPMMDNIINIVILDLWNQLKWNLKRNQYIFIQENALESVVWKMAAVLSRPQCVELMVVEKEGVVILSEEYGSENTWNSKTYLIFGNQLSYLNYRQK